MASAEMYKHVFFPSRRHSHILQSLEMLPSKLSAVGLDQALALLYGYVLMNFPYLRVTLNCEIFLFC